MFRTTVHSVLVPVTLNEEGTSAIRQAMCIYGKFYPHITLLHVIPSRPLSFRWFRPVARKRCRRQAFDRFQKFVAAHFHGEIPPFISLKLKQGTLVKTLVSQINRLKYDLVILNKKLEQRPKMQPAWEAGIRLVVGEAFCPVLTFNGTPCDNQISRIMVPVDISRPHKHNVAWAIELALRYHAAVHIVSVLGSNIKMEKSRIYRKVKMIERKIRSAHLPCEITILRSEDKKLHEVIPGFINRHRPDLVLIMTHQEAVLDINYIGKLASGVLKESEQPVFAITPKKETLVTSLLDILKTK